MKRSICVLVAMAACASSAYAGQSFTGATYSENFDTLPLTTQTGAFSATAGVQANIPGIAAGTWQGAKIAGTGSTGPSLIADAGTSSTGALFSYGTSAVSTERALGALASGTNIMAFGVAITNNASDALSEFTITFDGEAWRSSTTAQNLLAFAWGQSSTAGLDETNFLSNASMTTAAAGNILGPAPVGSNGAINPPTVTAYSVTITGLNIAVGETLFLRWQDANDGGNDAGLAIDNFSFNAVVVPAPGAIALLGLGALVGIRRKR